MQQVWRDPILLSDLIPLLGSQVVQSHLNALQYDFRVGRLETVVIACDLGLCRATSYGTLAFVGRLARRLFFLALYSYKSQG
jgi:hypothetical protein